MGTGEQRPDNPYQDHPIEHTLSYVFNKPGVDFGGDQEILQFKGDLIRRYSFVPTGEIEVRTYEVDGRTVPIEHAVKQQVLIAEYDGFDDMSRRVQAERLEFEDATRDERESISRRIGAAAGPPVVEVVLDEPEGLRAFKAEMVTPESIIETAKQIVALREQSGIEDDTIACANCDGAGELHFDDCGCQGGHFKKEDMYGNILESHEPGSPDPDCSDCHGKGTHDVTCVCCGGEGSIPKYPSLTLTNCENGQSVDIKFDIAKLIAEGSARITRILDEKALSNGHIDYIATTWIILSEWLDSTIRELGLDPGNTGIIAEGRFYDASTSLSFDLQASYEHWERKSDSPMMGIHAGEIKAFRKANQTAGMLSQGKPTEVLTPGDIISAAQHQLADYVPSAFGGGNGPDAKQHRELGLVPLETVSQAFVQLKAAAERTGNTLGYTSSWYNDQSYVFYLLNERDEIEQAIEQNFESFRSAVENAKLSLMRR